MDNTKLRGVLEDVGFTKGESKIYLALLELGESKVGPLIKSSGISRSKVYDILKEIMSEIMNFKKSNKLKDGDGYGILWLFCMLEKDLNINIWDEDLKGLKTINDLTLIVTHELIRNKKR